MSWEFTGSNRNIWENFTKFSFLRLLNTSNGKESDENYTQIAVTDKLTTKCRWIES